MHTNGGAAITWTTVGESSRYVLQIDNLTTGERHVIREDNLITASFTVNSLPADNYRAWVRAVNADSNQPGPWSRHVDFSVASGVPLEKEGFGIELESLLPQSTTNDAKNRKYGPMPDKRILRRYKRRLVVEHTISWLHNCRRTVVRREYHVYLFIASISLAAITIVLKRFVGCPLATLSACDQTIHYSGCPCPLCN